MLPMDGLQLGEALVLVATPRPVGGGEEPPPAQAVAGGASAAAASPVRVCLVAEDGEGEGEGCSIAEWRLTAGGFLVWTELDEEAGHRLASAAPLPVYAPWAASALVTAVAVPAALSWLHTQVSERAMPPSLPHPSSCPGRFLAPHPSLSSPSFPPIDQLQASFVGEGDLLDSLAYEVVAQLGGSGILGGAGEGGGGGGGAAVAKELLLEPTALRQLLRVVAEALEGDAGRSGEGGKGEIGDEEAHPLHTCVAPWLSCARGVVGGDGGEEAHWLSCASCTLPQTSSCRSRPSAACPRRRAWG